MDDRDPSVPVAPDGSEKRTIVVSELPMIPLLDPYSSLGSFTIGLLVFWLLLEFSHKCQNPSADVRVVSAVFALVVGCLSARSDLLSKSVVALHSPLRPSDWSTDPIAI